MAIPFQCSCGSLRGEVDPGDAYVRAVCYCRDCQAYARVLGRAQDVLDAGGGTDIVAMRPGGLRFTAGREHLTCLSLSPKGPLRWHSACCNTPLANTARQAKLPYAGLVSRCLSADAAEVDVAFGAPRIALNTGSANGVVAATPVGTALGVARIACGVLLAKLRGRDRDNPFFVAGTSRPLAEPRVLTLQERRDATPR